MSFRREHRCPCSSKKKRTEFDARVILRACVTDEEHLSEEYHDKRIFVWVFAFHALRTAEILGLNALSFIVIYLHAYNGDLGGKRNQFTVFSPCKR